MQPVLGAERTEKLIHSVNALEEVRDTRDLRPLFTI